MNESSEQPQIYHPLHAQYLDRIRKEKGLPPLNIKPSNPQAIQSILQKTAPPWPVNLNAPASNTAAYRENPSFVSTEIQSALQHKEAELLSWEKELDEKDRFLRAQQARLDNRERSLNESEMLQNARDRYLEEKVRLLDHREDSLKEQLKVIRTQPVKDPAQASADAVQKMLKELNERESALLEKEKMVQEREKFVETSENELFLKAQEIFEKEEELASLNEELLMRKEKYDIKDGLIEPPAKDIM
jgi:uncharacterized protein (DUF3084 family)